MKITENLPVMAVEIRAGLWKHYRDFNSREQYQSEI
jgi:hypothetical protein